MDRKGTQLQILIAASGLLVLIFDSELALEGAGSGIDLCIKTVIPSLFPFFVLSMLLTDSLSGRFSGILQKLACFLGVPESGMAVLIPAILGGYPVGAKCVGDLYQKKQINRRDAERLLAFCSNAGPSFLFGMVSGFFPDKKASWLLWFIHILSAVLTALILPANNMEPVRQAEKPTENTPILLSAAKAMVLVCCWVILFRTVIAFLQEWFLWMLPGWAQVFFMGMIELTNGCCELLLITDISLRFILCSCMLSFGGICVLLQTVSVTQGLSVGWYIRGKLIQTAFSFLLSSAIFAKQGLFIAVWIPALMIILRKIQKRSRNPRSLPV